jgi:hypothetical protein
MPENYGFIGQHGKIHARLNLTALKFAKRSACPIVNCFKIGNRIPTREIGNRIPTREIESRIPTRERPAWEQRRAIPRKTEIFFNDA